MTRYRFSVKLPSGLEKAKKKLQLVTLKLFMGIIQSLKIIKFLNTEECPECIWNIDETSLFIDS